jgi:hypothetical protein
VTAPPQDGPTYVSDILETLNTALSAAFTGASRPFERVVRFPGIPSWDCEMIATWSSLRHTLTTRNRTPVAKQVSNVLYVSTLYLRCTTVFEKHDLPSADTVDADGVGYAIDQWIAHRTITRGIIDGTIFGGCSTAVLQAMREQNPQGGFSGFQTTIEVTI